jgi:chromosome segregation ATPase
MHQALTAELLDQIEGLRRQRQDLQQALKSSTQVNEELAANITAARRDVEKMQLKRMHTRTLTHTHAHTHTQTHIHTYTHTHTHT